MARRFGFLALLACLAGLAFAGGARAASIFDQLVTPGALSKAHEKLEADCHNCHKPFAKTAQDDLCAGCHKDIAADIAAKRGLHGRNPIVTSAGCKHCHIEHGGRNADITRLDRTAFDHGVTDFALTGAHVTTACASCHKPDVKFRTAPRSCIGCHSKDDVHKASLGDGCAACHGTASWKATAFNHDRDTKFPLTGGHARLTCQGCHRGDVKTHPTPTECVSCHGATDPHKGKLGPRCEACHDTSDWKRILFDHDQSDFPLIGKHAKVACADCHRTPDFRATPIACISCHQDKQHQGRLGIECGVCHNAVDWKLVRFDHQRDARYLLEGAHAIITCEKCHTQAALASLRLPTDCRSCHRSEDIHHGAFGDDCAKCHHPDNWKRAFIRQ
jgi:hypothetical protein